MKVHIPIYADRFVEVELPEKAIVQDESGEAHSIYLTGDPLVAAALEAKGYQKISVGEIFKDAGL